MSLRSCSFFFAILLIEGLIFLDEVTDGIKIGSMKAGHGGLSSMRSNDLPEGPTGVTDRSLIPLLVPDPQVLVRDRLLGSRHRPIANRTEFQHESDIMADTRRGLRQMLKDQRKRERNLNYLFVNKDQLTNPKFETNLVSRMKKMKGRVHHLLDLDHDAEAKNAND